MIPLLIKKNYAIFIVLIVCFLIILLNFSFNRLVIGLDNASPYFNILDVIKRIKGTSSVVYGGILFQLPFIYTLRVIGLTPEFVSNLYLSLNLILGSLGITLLTKRFTKNSIASLFAFIVLITSLFTFWIFSHPNFLFLASYGSIPLLIYFLSKEKIKSYDYISIIFLSLLFLTTSLNLVAFTLYILQIFVISIVLLKNKLQIKRILLWIFFILITWLSSIQFTMFLNGDTSLFIIQIFNYFKNLLSHPFINQISTDILSSEKTNSILNVSRFATGWMELHDSKNIPIFEYYSTYKENITHMLLGIVPFLLALFTVLFKKSKKNILLTLLFLIFLILSSKFGVTIIEKIPLLGEGLRWPTSKLWPIYIIPLTLLSATSITYLIKFKKIFTLTLVPLIFLVCIVYSLPVLKGNLLSSKTSINIPKEYFEIPRDSKILILPQPQKLYMREYEWGYYGSDFISYINSSEIVDGSNLYEYAPLYIEILKSGNIPNDIQYVLYDMSAEINLDIESLQESRGLVDSLKQKSLNSYFIIYER